MKTIAIAIVGWVIIFRRAIKKSSKELITKGKQIRLRVITLHGVRKKSPNDHFERVPKNILHIGGTNNIFANCK